MPKMSLENLYKQAIADIEKLLLLLERDIRTHQDVIVVHKDVSGRLEGYYKELRD